MKHAWLINVYTEQEQLGRQLAILRRYYAEDGFPVVHFSGPHEIPSYFTDLSTIQVAPHEPDKCAGICNALSALIDLAYRQGAEAATLLHPDMVPMHREHWRLFLRRFLGSKKTLTFAPIRPGGRFDPPCFCALTFRLPEALRLFPIRLDRNEHWMNEAQAWISWNRHAPGWLEEIYPVTMLNWPHSTCPEGGEGAKRMHGHRFNWVYHDYCLDSSVIHTNDPVFWSRYDAVAQF